MLTLVQCLSRVPGRAIQSQLSRTRKYVAQDTDAHARQVLSDLSEEAAFKQIWLVGSTADQVFKLWPRE